MAATEGLLVDTSVLLEFLLDQKRADEVARFFEESQDARMHVTDLAVHSVGIILEHRRLQDVFVRFLDDIFRARGTELVRLGLDQLEIVMRKTAEIGLDFDDAYQYVAAEKHALTLVSFDADFDRTERGRKTPRQILEESRHPGAGPASVPAAP